MRGLRAALCAILICLGCGAARAEVAIPPVARVTDLTGTLSAQQQQALSAKLAAFEENKGSQIAVLMVPTTQPETIEQYGIRVADAWKLGRKGVDDGLIFLIARNDHRVRLEVGYGLEGVVPDATANDIIDLIVVPYFRKGDFYDGIDKGIDALIKVINGEPLPAPRPHQTRRQTGNPLGIAFIAFFIMLMVGRGFHRRFGLGPASAGVGVGTGVIAGLVTASLATGLLAGFGGLALALMMLSGGGGGGFGGPFGGIGYWGGLGGGLGGGGFGGGGFGGGGFSGGGGGFGGGGASGGW